MGQRLGLYTFGGDTDAGLPIQSSLRLPVTLRENTLKQQIAMVYLSMQGQGEAEFTVFGSGGQAWSYPFPLRDSGRTRCPVGKGIRENYLGFGLSTLRWAGLHARSRGSAEREIQDTESLKWQILISTARPRSCMTSMSAPSTWRTRP